MLDLARGGQHVVGVERGVGDEQVVHDGEQVVAQETLANPALIRHRHHRIGAVHDERSDRRLQVAVAEILAEIAHVQDADAGLVHLGPRHAVHVQDGEVQLVCGTGQAAAAMPPRSGEHRQAGHRAKLHRAVAMMLGADERPQQGRLRRRVLARESLDVVRRQAHRVRHALRSVLPHALRERLVADRVLRHVVVVHQAVANDDVHHRERQRPRRWLA